MCILLKLDYAKFGVSNLFLFQKLSKKNLGKGRVKMILTIESENDPEFNSPQFFPTVKEASLASGIPVSSSRSKRSTMSPLKGNSCLKKNLTQTTEHEKCKKKLAITDLNAPNGSRDIPSQSEEFEQDGRRHSVGFQPHFYIDMTSQTQFSKMMKK